MLEKKSINELQALLISATDVVTANRPTSSLNKLINFASFLLSFFCSVKDYGLFLTEDDPRKGAWLEPGRTLEYYTLKDHVSLFNF